MSSPQRSIKIDELLVRTRESVGATHHMIERVHQGLGTLRRSVAESQRIIQQAQQLVSRSHFPPQSE
ncbi:MAG: hypothetical protein ABIT76_04250 [Chthoniobacterales bacterium]